MGRHSQTNSPANSRSPTHSQSPALSPPLHFLTFHSLCPYTHFSLKTSSFYFILFLKNTNTSIHLGVKHHLFCTSQIIYFFSPFYRNSPFPYKMKIHLELHLMSSLCLLSVDDVYEQYWLAAEWLMVHKIKPRLSAAQRLPSGSHVVKACWEYKFQTDNQVNTANSSFFSEHPTPPPFLPPPLFSFMESWYASCCCQHGPFRGLYRQTAPARQPPPRPPAWAPQCLDYSLFSRPLSEPLFCLRSPFLSTLAGRCVAAEQPQQSMTKTLSFCC